MRKKEPRKKTMKFAGTEARKKKDKLNRDTMGEAA